MYSSKPIGDLGPSEDWLADIPRPKQDIGSAKTAQVTENLLDFDDFLGQSVVSTVPMNTGDQAPI